MKTVNLLDICNPKQWKTVSQVDLSEKGYPCYSANGKIGFYKGYNHEFPTLLIGCRGTCGSLHITEPFSYTSANAMALDNLDTDLVDIKFLYYFFRKRGFKDIITGSSQPQITRQGLQKIQIPLPPLEDQKRIVKILDEADLLRQKRKKAIDLLDDYLRSVFLEMFGNPVKNSKGWPTQKFDKLGTLDRGKSKHRPRNAPELLGGKHPLIQTGDVANASLYIDNYNSTYSDIGLKQSKKWPKGTLCITIAANIAKTGILNFDACFPDSVVGFVANTEKTNTVYVHFWMSFFQKILEANAPESAQKNINLRILRDLDVISPPFQLQCKFSDIVQKTESLRQKMLVQYAELETQFQTLMQKTFKGEL